jgi:hypothetical protein
VPSANHHRSFSSPPPWATVNEKGRRNREAGDINGEKKKHIKKHRTEKEQNHRLESPPTASTPPNRRREPPPPPAAAPWAAARSAFLASPFFLLLLLPHAGSTVEQWNLNYNSRSTIHTWTVYVNYNSRPLFKWTLGRINSGPSQISGPVPARSKKYFFKKIF